MTPPTTIERQVLTADDLAALTTLSPRTIRERVQKHGHILGVRPIPDTGRRVLFSAARIYRAIEEQAS